MFPIDEGYIKYRIHWLKHPLIVSQFARQITALNHTRKLLYLQKWIGYDATLKVGYGNLSLRTPPISKAEFLISGTQTGHLSQLQLKNYSLVRNYDIDSNELWCEGETKASSEALTHAAIYELNSDYQSVIHIHCKPMWLKLLHKIPTTAENVSYGTPEMAYEIQRLYQESNLRDCKIVAMAGHEDGIVAFGSNLEEAYRILNTEYRMSD